jgi:hypothetical protein
MLDECRRKRQMLQRSAVNNDELSQVPPIVHEVLRSPGRPLDSTTRTFMETRFGHDFSHVRLHTDTRAAESARAVNAQAYTVGRDVVFGTGQYWPEAYDGRKLLVHELVHVVQQSRPTSPAPMTRWISSGQHLQYDREAESRANTIDADVQLRVLERAPHGTVQRAAPAAAAPAIGALAVRCILGLLASMALDAAIQYGQHLWRLRRWPWERARESWESYRHDWCMTVLSAVLGCLGGIVAARWIEPFLRGRFPQVFGEAGAATLLGRLLMWLATQGILAPRFVVKWLGKLGCITLGEAESLYPGITAEESMAEAPGPAPVRPGEEEAPA